MSDVLQDRDDVAGWIVDNVYDPANRPGEDRVGLEVELFPFWTTQGGGPAARLALVEVIAVLDDVAGAERRADGPDGRPSWDLNGALITEEPGAQVEIAGPPDVGAETAVDRVEDIAARLASAFDAAGAALVGAGLDLWTEPDQVPVQVDVPRYDAMSTYFRRRGTRHGHLLMCASCSLQINVDLGPPGVARQRWLVANLAAPLVTAAFAASPDGDDVNGRALGWLGLDPTRTGFPPPLVAGVDDPVQHAVADALRADVLLVTRGGQAHAGRPGWSFGDWVGEPHPEFGAPTTEDLQTHLSTLFPEARLRGYMEVRGVDELPARWRGAAVALVVGLLYDDGAREAALDRLLPHRGELPALLARAAHDGLGDDVLADLATDVLDHAHEGATRLGIRQARDAADYLERFVHRRRHPSDELRTALAQSPAAAFDWARSRGHA